MKFSRLLLVIVLFFGAFVALVLIGKIFFSAAESFPVKETYYYIPEAELYVKFEGSKLRLSKSLGVLKSDYGYRTDFRIKNNIYNSTIYYQLGEYSRVFVSDPHNCLVCLRSICSIVWLSEMNTGFVVPPSVEINLPVKENLLLYRLPDGANHQAIVVDKETVSKEKVDSEVFVWDFTPLDILPEQKQFDTIEGAKISIENNGGGVITLHVRDNWIECDTPHGEMYGYYPSFYYNPLYPSYLYCDGYSYILFKKCIDLQLVISQLTECEIKEKGLGNWYKITLNPFQIKEIIL